jgi:hypothetical protein
MRRNGRPHADSDRHTDPDRHANCDADPDRNSHDHANRNADSDRDPDSYANCNADSDCNPDLDAGRDSDSDPDPHADPRAGCDAATHLGSDGAGVAQQAPQSRPRCPGARDGPPLRMLPAPLSEFTSSLNPIEREGGWIKKRSSFIKS